MGNITEQQRKPFENAAHKDVAQFHFTSDDMPFFQLNDALQHGRNLKVKGKSDVVVTITKVEYDAEIAAEKLAEDPFYGLSPLEKAQKVVNMKNEGVVIAQGNFDKAMAALALANTAKAELPTDATGPQKTTATKNVNKATALVGDMQVALDNSNSEFSAAVDALNALKAA